jgi:hypothetical protein
LIEIDRQQIELHRRAFLHVEEQIQQRVTVFAARHANHHAIAIGDHAKVFDRFAHAPQQTRLDLCCPQTLLTECHAAAGLTNLR